jgi:CheY-like chemotaxis protein
MIRPKLLCVDDDASLRELYRTFLESYGYEVVVAESGPNALDVFSSSPVRAVVLDYDMPAMNGSEVAAVMKGINPAVPIIMVSGCKSVVEEAPRFVDAAIGKGSEVGVLLDKLQQLMGLEAEALPSARSISPLVPLGSALATIALVAFVLPRLWK